MPYYKKQGKYSRKFNKKRYSRNLLNAVHPYAIRVSGDPPAIQSTKPRCVYIHGTFTLADNIKNITLGDVKALIQDQVYAGATVTFYWQLLKAMAYGPCGANANLRLIDDNTEIESQDFGTLSKRPACALAYPPAGQEVTFSSANGNVLKLVGGATDLVDVRFYVRVWAKSEQ